MWTHLAPWLVKTGEVPQLEVGDTLTEVGVRAVCWSLGAADGPDALAERAGADPSGDESPHYELTGTLEWADEPDAAVVRVDGLGLVAGPRSPGAPEFVVPAAGATVSAVARLEAMLPYDAEGSGAPDVRRDWRVLGIRVEHRALVSSPLYPGQTEPGRIVRVDEIGRMLRWGDASSRDHASYLLDLALLPDLD